MITIKLSPSQISDLRDGIALEIGLGDRVYRITTETSPHPTRVTWQQGDREVAFVNRDLAPPGVGDYSPEELANHQYRADLPWHYQVRGRTIGHLWNNKKTIGDAIKRVEELLRGIHGLRTFDKGEIRLLEHIPGWRPDPEILAELNWRGL